MNCFICKRDKILIGPRDNFSNHYCIHSACETCWNKIYSKTKEPRTIRCPYCRLNIIEWYDIIRIVVCAKCDRNELPSKMCTTCCECSACCKCYDCEKCNIRCLKNENNTCKFCDECCEHTTCSGCSKHLDVDDEEEMCQYCSLCVQCCVYIDECGI